MTTMRQGEEELNHPTQSQANTGHNNVQMNHVENSIVNITQVFHAPCSPHPVRERTLTLQGLALAPISASIATPNQPALSLGLLALGAVLAVLS